MIPLFAHQIAVSMLDYIDFWLDEENEMSIRDRAMANNVDFLKTVVYPDEKIIIWAHNLHIRHNNHQLDLSAYSKIKSMGSWLHDKYPDELYTIGLYMYEGQGTYNNREIYDVTSHSPNSLESIFHFTGYESCFVDLKHQKTVEGNEWMSSEILTKTWGLQDLRMIPRNQYDAILFIDTVSPPDYLD
jgi:erythromycin esterase